MEILEGIKTRRSIRAFKPDPIPRDVLNKILEAANASPSYTNTQPWEVVVATGKKKDEVSGRILELARAKAAGTPDIATPKSWPAGMEQRSREHGARRLAALGIAREDEAGREKMRLMNFQFYGAPCIVCLFTEPGVPEWSIYDMGLFSQTLILAAHALGVESCLQASVTAYAPEIKKALGVDPKKKLVICIALGYPDEGAKLNTYRALRQKPEDFTKWVE